MHAFEQQLASQWDPKTWQDVTVVVAISGGPDSVALLRALHSILAPGAGRLIAAHFNHRLRGAESEEDAAFVGAVAAELQIAVQIGASLTTDRAGRTSEESARNERYEFLRAVAGSCGARFLATAHTADDQAETILHRIVRGTGIDGLAGIARAREWMPGVALVRPLLGTWRSEVMNYLSDMVQPFRNDSTNAAPAFTRNRIRHELLPVLEATFNPRVKEALCRLGELADERQQYVASVARDLAARVVARKDERHFALCVGPLAEAHDTVLREMLAQLWIALGWPQRDMSLSHWRDLMALCRRNSPDGRRSLPGDIRADRCGGTLVVEKQAREIEEAEV